MKQNENENKKYEYFIYKIYNPECDYVYVGSTRSMKVRKSCHKSHCNNVNGAQYNYKVYKTIREHNGWNEWFMIVLEVMPDVTKLTAEIREDEWRVELNATLNSKKATRGDITVAQYHKEYDKIYKIQNKEHINQKHNCDCGGKYTTVNKIHHLKTKKHQKYISNLNN